MRSEVRGTHQPLADVTVSRQWLELTDLDLSVGPPRPGEAEVPSLRPELHGALSLACRFPQGDGRQGLARSVPWFPCLRQRPSPSEVSDPPGQCH